MSNVAVEELKKSFPAVEFVYPLAIASYEVMQKRLDALDGRLQTLLTFIVSVSLAIPVVASNKGLSFRSGWFIAAICAFFASVGVGTYARLCKKLVVIDPGQLFTDYLDMSEWEFKKDTIYWAGVNFKANQEMIDWKAKLANITAMLFILEAVLVAAWVVAA